MDKLAELQKLEAELAANTALPLREANLVFGEGSVECAVMFVGEAPGFHEDQQKRPFVGRAGQLLDTLIREVGWKRADVYITNIVKRRPPENRDPLPDEIEAYKPYLTKQLEIIDPKVVVALGRFAMNYFLPDAKISRDHGRLFKIGERLVFPIYHPAAALRSTEMLNTLREDFKKLPQILKGELAAEAAPTVAAPVMPAAKKAGAAAAKKPAKLKQSRLF